MPDRRRDVGDGVEDGLRLIFDGHCSFCTWAARLIARLDQRHRVSLQPFQTPGVAEAAGLSRWQCQRAAYAVTPEGHLLRGAGAVHAAIAWSTGHPWLVYLYWLPVVRPVEDAAYWAISRLRPRLPGVTPLCKDK